MCSAQAAEVGAQAASGGAQNSWGSLQVAKRLDFGTILYPKQLIIKMPSHNIVVLAGM